MDLITVGITCYEAQNTIERAVRSALAQTWVPFEIVVVDDCSTDGSWQILERLSTGTPRIRIVRHPENRGVAAARNTLLEHANGEFVAFFDDDDVSHPERLESQWQRIVDYEQAAKTSTVVCHSATEQLFPDGTKRYSPTLGMDVTPAPTGDAVARLILTGEPAGGDSGACPTSSQMARRSVYESVGGFDEELRRQEDTDLNLRLAISGAHFAGLAQPLVSQTVTVTGDKTAAEEQRASMQLIEKHRRLLEQWGWYNFNLRWTKLKYAVIERGAFAAIPGMARLLFTAPVKLARKTAWTAPNRASYRRYRYPNE
jgi:glycosyltransferase involved in cell wall biosynthesis